MLIPEVVGFELTGTMMEGTTATDLVLKVVQMLREKGVVGKFVEFYGDGLDTVPLADRATIGNMAPEYGATCGFFPIDAITLKYLEQTGRDTDRIALVEAYAKENGMWRDTGYEPIYTDTLELDMGDVVPAISGPKRPQDHIALDEAAKVFHAYVKGEREGKDATPKEEIRWEGEGGQPEPRHIPGDEGHHSRGYVEITDIDGDREAFQMHDGSIVIASITSCTNTSNPYVMIGAGLVARKAREKGLNRKPWVKTSLAPGSQVVSAYLEAAELQEDLDAIGFNLVGYGCTTCIGNSGPLDPAISKCINDNDLIGVSVLSGNRNFEGRISPDVRANYLASPPLVVAYALVGDMNVDITREPLGQDKDGNDVYLKDIWPSQHEIAELVEKTVTREAFQSKYADVFKGDEKWQGVEVTEAETYDWPATSTYVQNPPYFRGMSKDPGTISNIEGARVLALLGDMITTDHISPAGSFKESTPAGQYLVERQVPVREFNSYGSRRGNHEIMMRGTFANIRIKNEMLDGVEGGYTKGPDGKQMSIYDAAMAYKEAGVPLVVIGGEQYGAGSSRDWAAKGTALLGVKAVIAESFERIHRSNLVGMGVIPFEFTGGDTRASLGLTGEESFSIHGLEGDLKPLSNVPCTITYADGTTKQIEIKCRIDTAIEIEYIEHGGVLHYVLRNLAKAA
jgi:aconitate hydratase